MINHARTLLLNRAAEPAQASLPGAAWTDPQFTPVALNNGCLAIRRVLFGANPDSWMLNYRGWQLLALLHACPDLAQHVLELDSRVTYDLTQNPFSLRALYPISVAVQDGAALELSPTSEFAPPDSSGQMQQIWDIQLTGATATSRLRGGQLSRTDNYTMSGGISSECVLAGTSTTYRFSDPGSGASVVLTKVTRPENSLTRLFERCQRTSGLETAFDLFGDALQEPFRSFQQLYQNHYDLAHRFGGLLLALIYRTEQLRA